MQTASTPSAVYGPEHCNTQVTSLFVGQLYVHIFFAQDWPDFPGYATPLAQIWPISGHYIDCSSLPPMTTDEGIFLHEDN